jgi:PA14 domain
MTILKKNSVFSKSVKNFFAIGGALIVASCGAEPKFNSSGTSVKKIQPLEDTVPEGNSADSLAQSEGQSAAEDQLIENPLEKIEIIDSIKPIKTPEPVKPIDKIEPKPEPTIVPPRPTPTEKPVEVKPTPTPKPQEPYDCVPDLQKEFQGYSVKGGKFVEIASVQEHNANRYEVTFDSSSLSYNAGTVFAAAGIKEQKKVAGRVKRTAGQYCEALFSIILQPDLTFGSDTELLRGLTGRLYQIPEKSDKLPDFKRLDPVGKIYTSAFDITKRSFTQGFPGVDPSLIEWFAIDFTGKLVLSEPGEYQFKLISDDGSKLFINDRLVVDNDGWHDAIEKVSDKIQMSAGEKDVRIQYYQGPRYFIALELLYKGPSMTDWKYVPQSMLKSK